MIWETGQITRFPGFGTMTRKHNDYSRDQVYDGDYGFPPTDDNNEPTPNASKRQRSIWTYQIWPNELQYSEQGWMSD